MFSQIHFTGPAPYRIRSTAEIGESIVEVSFRRMRKGPHLPSWSWFVELCTQVLKVQVNGALEMRDVHDARRYLNSVVVTSPALSGVSITRVSERNIKGKWFKAKGRIGDVTLLYFHGGGYSYYPRPYENVIALITQSARAQTFALDYSLTPENRYPAQLYEALDAYRWFLDSGTDPSSLVVAGDSAGGNLALVLLLAARASKLPQPALAIALSPPTDFEAEITDNDFDWINRQALVQWADWFCGPGERRDPLVSPIRAKLHGLAPIYIQAGRSEVLFDSIQDFAHYAQTQAADVVLESWKEMPHVFQVFGPDAPPSAEALRRIGEMVDARVRTKRKRAMLLE
jgi:epsilon-lactone hydrolase